MAKKTNIDQRTEINVKAVDLDDETGKKLIALLTKK